jgi:hypothetical protein
MEGICLILMEKRSKARSSRKTKRRCPNKVHLLLILLKEKVPDFTPRNLLNTPKQLNLLKEMQASVPEKKILRFKKENKM